MWDGCELVRRSYHGLYSRIPHSDGALAGEQSVTETRNRHTERVLSTVVIATTVNKGRDTTVIHDRGARSDAYDGSQPEPRRVTRVG